MFSTKIKLNAEAVVVHANKTVNKNQGKGHAYHAPELHAIGKAIVLVQGGGGSYADNNRARQY